MLTVRKSTTGRRERVRSIDIDDVPQLPLQARRTSTQREADVSSAEALRKPQNLLSFNGQMADPFTADEVGASVQI
jgi:hypothetical protein